MAQSRYLSTDPQAGAEASPVSKYLSTDPNAGLDETTPSTLDMLIAGAKDVGVGAAKQVGRTAIGTLSLINRLPIGNPAAGAVLSNLQRMIPADTNTAQKAGGVVADIGTAALPLGKAAEAVDGMRLLPRLFAMGASGGAVSEAQGHNPVSGAIGGTVGEGLASATEAAAPAVQRLAGRVWTNAANEGTPETAADILARGRGVPTRSNTAALAAEARAGDVPAKAAVEPVITRNARGQIAGFKRGEPAVPAAPSPLWPAVKAHEAGNARAVASAALGPADILAGTAGYMLGHGPAGAAAGEAVRLLASPGARMAGAQAAYSTAPRAAALTNSAAVRALLLSMLARQGSAPSH